MFKKTKKMKVVLATLLALALTLGLAPMSYADDPDISGQREAAITKVLKVPIGTALPEGSFVFDVDGVSVNGITSVAPPAIGQVVIPIPDQATLIAEQPDPPGDVDIYYFESDSIFENTVWPEAGIYEYFIAENATDSADYFTLDPNKETLSYSVAGYQVKVYVREYDDDDEKDGLIPQGKSIGDPYIYAIGAKRTITEDGTPGTDKVDPTPGGDQDTYFYSQMTFTNIYTKRGGTGTEDPDDPDNVNALSITKAVTGDFGSKTAYFPFTVTFVQPSLVTAAQTYRGYILDGDGNIIDPATNGVASTAIATDGLGQKYVKFPSGSGISFGLQDGQKIAFTDVHIGSGYAVVEAGSPGYVATAIVVTAGAADNKTGSGLSNGITISGQRVGEEPNSVAVTNEYDGEIDTGILINNLPFFSLIALAGLGLIVFLVAKNRRRKAEEL